MWRDSVDRLAIDLAVPHSSPTYLVEHINWPDLDSTIHHFFTASISSNILKLEYKMDKQTLCDSRFGYTSIIMLILLI